MFFCIVLTPISTTSGLRSTSNMRKYQQIDVYIYQCVCCALAKDHVMLITYRCRVSHSNACILLKFWAEAHTSMRQHTCNMLGYSPDPTLIWPHSHFSLTICRLVELFVKFDTWIIVYIIVIPWVVYLYVEIIHEL